MKKIPKKKRKVTELYFNEYDGTAEIYTYNTKLKKRLTAYAATYPDLCQLIEDDENGGLRFEIDKGIVTLLAPFIKFIMSFLHLYANTRQYHCTYPYALLGYRCRHP